MPKYFDGFPYRIKGARAMLIKITVHVVAAALSMLAGTHSVAIERLDGEKFMSACRSYETYRGQPGAEADKALCSAFLLGYVAASAQYLDTEQGRRSFHDKAVETRVRGLIRKDMRLQDQRYCVPPEESVDRMVSRINEIRLMKEGPRFAENVVESVLNKYYRCTD